MKVSIGPGFLLFVVFLVLKLCGVVAWRWLWVTGPLWIPFGLWGAITLAVLVIVSGRAIFNAMPGRRIR